MEHGMRASDKGRLASEHRSGCAFLRLSGLGGICVRGRRFHGISSEQATLASFAPAFLAFARCRPAQGTASCCESACRARKKGDQWRRAMRASERLALLRSEGEPSAQAHTFLRWAQIGSEICGLPIAD